jgi:hypothetical protein
MLREWEPTVSSLCPHVQECLDDLGAQLLARSVLGVGVIFLANANATMTNTLVNEEVQMAMISRTDWDDW